MTAIILTSLFASPFAWAIIQTVRHRATIFDRTDDLSNQGADEGGRGFIQHEGLSK